MKPAALPLPPIARLPRQPKAVVFDLDGTLIDSEALVQEALGVQIAVTDLFRFTTVRALARHLATVGKGGGVVTAAQAAMERAKARREGLRRR